MATITIAAEHVDELRAAALGLYAVKAESIHVAANDYLGDRESLDPVVHHRDESHDVEALIDQLGWPFERQAEPVALSGPAYLLGELLEAALIGRLESLLDALTAAERDTPLDLEAIASELGQANALIGLLADVSAQDRR